MPTSPNQSRPEHEPDVGSHENEESEFSHKFRELLPGVAFEESAEMRDARTAILEALNGPNQDPEFLRSVWIEYAKVCEEAVDQKTPTFAEEADSKIRAWIRMQLQIASFVHKALIFREAGNLRRYGQELTIAEEYALTKHIDEVAMAIGTELDELARRLSL
ncbi:MAG: hypothetical protein JWP06_574 [Candidatus Saccharibacteria bacterium]|nr:hypothetical protein [Candidatus Saccharibacteria bacterium]